MSEPRLQFMLRHIWLIVLIAAPASLRAGFVRTLDGRAFEGEVELVPDAGGSVMVTPLTGTAVKVALSKVLHVAFKAEAMAAKPRTGLPLPWRNTDVMRAGVAGTASLDGEVFTLTVGGKSPAENLDSMHLVWQPMGGDGQLIARLTGLEGTGQCRAGLVIRDSVGGGAVGAAILLQQPRGLYFQRRLVGGNKNAVAQVNQAIVPPLWLKLARTGNKIEVFQSQDGQAWQAMGAENLRLGINIAVGMCVVGPGPNVAAKATFDSVSMRLGNVAAAPANTGPEKGVILRNGTALACELREMNTSQLKLSLPRDQTLTVSTPQVARILLRPLKASLAGKIPAGASGALLDSGDFFEGEVQSLSPIRVSSVLFGIRHFDLTSAVAIVLRDVKREPSAFRVVASNGSIILADSITVDRDAITINAPLLGAVKMTENEILEIGVGAARLTPLAELPVAGASGGIGGSAYTVDGVPGGVPMSLGGLSVERGVGVAAGATVTYSLAGRSFGALVAKVGVPAGILPTSALRFVVTADDKEIYRSPDRTSLDEPLSIAVPLASAKTLGLRVENTSNEVGGCGLWAEPSLVAP